MTFLRRTFLAVSLIAAVPITSIARAASAPSPNAEWSRTIEAAKKEGKVSVFLYHRENIETAIRVFEKLFLTFNS
ncbi:MAG: hypothetical protein ACREOR_02605 [Candidatus Binatia bacterium]